MAEDRDRRPERKDEPIDENGLPELEPDRQLYMMLVVPVATVFYTPYGTYEAVKLYCVGQN